MTESHTRRLAIDRATVATAACQPAHVAGFEIKLPSCLSSPWVVDCMPRSKPFRTSCQFGRLLSHKLRPQQRCGPSLCPTHACLKPAHSSMVCGRGEDLRSFDLCLCLPTVLELCAFSVSHGLLHRALFSFDPVLKPEPYHGMQHRSVFASDPASKLEPRLWRCMTVAGPHPGAGGCGGLRRGDHAAAPPRQQPRRPGHAGGIGRRRVASPQQGPSRDRRVESRSRLEAQV